MKTYTATYDPINAVEPTEPVAVIEFEALAKPLASKVAERYARDHALCLNTLAEAA